MDAAVKQEISEAGELTMGTAPPKASVSNPDVIELSSSGSDDDSDDDSVLVKRSRDSNGVDGDSSKKQKFDVVLPLGFLDPLPPEEPVPMRETVTPPQPQGVASSCKQFWKAGDYEGAPGDCPTSSLSGMDHVRVHPKFLHSNATSHKWALGAFAELLDNSLDEICHGATYVNIDMLKNEKDGSRVLLVEDNGGGMDPDKMRQCMSLGYSAKSKLANTIGQYGNGFKTSTMRLGADVIVFSRCHGKDGKSPTQSIGMLSYTFLRSTGKEDIVVPMIDYEKVGSNWKKVLRSSPGDWNTNLDTIVQWSPYSDEDDLLQQFNYLKEQGTRILIYNLWEDDQGELELDFDTDPHDIQIRGVNRDEKKIQMAKQFPNSRHFLTYRHSLRSYSSILYLRLPHGFRIILRGKDVEHHNLVKDMMLTEKITYRPQPGAYGVPKESNMVAVVTIGFVKDAKDHIDIQGFNPFWRVWNAAGSDGRGVIGVLEANFVEPAHDKQGFERTTVLSRLEARLVQMQKNYWSTNCHKIGYAPRRQKKLVESASGESSPEYLPHRSKHSEKAASPSRRREPERSLKTVDPKHGNAHMNDKGENGTKNTKGSTSKEPLPPFLEDDSDTEIRTVPLERVIKGSSNKTSPKKSFTKDGSLTKEFSHPCSGTCKAQRDDLSNGHTARSSQAKAADRRAHSSYSEDGLNQLGREDYMSDRLRKVEAALQFERDRCKSLEDRLNEAEQRIEEMNKEQEALIDIFSEERNRRDSEEENLRKKLKDASNTIQELLDKVRLLEKMRSPKS
ncbi:PREDICTED: protein MICRORCHIDIA 7 isoform X2 [Nelumbo nucifera]|uniref:Protein MICRORCHIDIA 7 isoform X2 n=1 Tax=Nelumbo nucifera TaxID=4432 RepID=A0A1U7ZAS0_NELNU|nr:PREDICTED: protein MICRORCHIDIA 7 isoform X2 [Nelumbo nucifera]